MNVLCAALAVLLDFLLQVTAFVALIVFDFLRDEDNRVDCFPCIKVSGSSSEMEKGIIVVTFLSRAVMTSSMPITKHITKINIS